jgi:hypothetical protein
MWLFGKDQFHVAIVPLKWSKLEEKNITYFAKYTTFSYFWQSLLYSLAFFIDIFLSYGAAIWFIFAQNQNNLLGFKLKWLIEIAFYFDYTSLWVAVGNESNLVQLKTLYFSANSLVPWGREHRYSKVRPQS